MSTIQTLSQFYFGHTVTADNKSLDFKEGAGAEIQADLRVGAYSLTEFVTEIERVLNTYGTQDYTVTVNRTTGIITVSAASAFTLLAGTGSRIGTGIWELMGFDPSDATGTTVVGDNRSGKVYRPQYILKNYSSPEHFKLKESAAVNVSASGKVQVLQFGDGARMKCNIIAITNRTGLVIDPWYENATGIEDAIEFMDYLITKANVEFMPDFEDPDTYYNLLLDSTKSDRNGVGYELENMNTPDVYQTGDLTFRKVLT